MNHKRQNKVGFTLVELLVVISIIALLVSILMPALSQARVAAKNVVCQAHLKAWGQVFMLYTMDNDHKFMAGFDQFADRNAAMDNCWVNVTREYYNEPEIRLCVAAKSARDAGQADPMRGWSTDFVGDDSIEDELIGSYGINWWVNNPKKTAWDGTFAPENKWRKTDVGNANMIPLLGDSTFFLARPQHDDQPPQENGTEYYSNYGLDRFCVTRHKGKINLLFMDASVRPVNIRGELWSLKWHRNYDNTNNTGSNNFLEDSTAWENAAYGWVPRN